MASPSKELKYSKDSLISQFLSGQISETYRQSYTEILDQYFRTSLQESRSGQILFRGKKPFALMAVGGYGRGELSLHSDIDILVLFGKKIPQMAKALVKEVFYPLWDLGFDVSYGTRNISDCISLSRVDFEVLTSMLDARFIGGDSKLYLSLMENFEKKVISKKAIAFSKWLENRDQVRMETFGDASHLLEPNLKEGIGGLRDYHQVLWLAKAFFHLRTPRELEYTGKLSDNEYKSLIKHLNFIWLVRNHLHQLSGRKKDRLGFEHQEEIAQRLGFRKEKDLLAVEQFLGELHASMAAIKSLHRSFVISYLPKRHKIKSDFPSYESTKDFYLSEAQINFNSATAILSNPYLLMDIFQESSQSGYPLSMEARRLVREFLHLVDDEFRKSEKVVGGFLNIINGENTFKILDMMYDTGFLEVFIPEFGLIADRVQFDAYHVFPVGRHSLETVRHIKDLPKQKEILLFEIYSGVSDFEPLLLACLFHDIGKMGKDHARRGVTITRRILERFGYEKSWIDEILFLVRNHLLLVETATRRDLHDEKVLVQCARTIGDVERLKMLYLLTWADSKATGPRAWNEWIANLVQEIFFKILHILEKGELATPDASRKVENTKSTVSLEVAGKTKQSDLDRLFEIMSPRYLLNSSPSAILSHLDLVKRLRERAEGVDGANVFIIETEVDESRSWWEVTFMGKDRPGLFSDISGVLALNNINILSSEVYTWRDGTVVDIFRVTRPLDTMLPNETWERVERDLRNTFSGKLSLPYRLSQKAAPTILSNHKKPFRSPKVLVDNESSDFFTLIEIFAEDRLGILYRITHTLFNLRLDIRIAKIATKGDLIADVFYVRDVEGQKVIADVFYVRDVEGQKVEDKKQVEEIKKALLHELER
jgi:[protein-PII] uridylyltransferase